MASSSGTSNSFTTLWLVASNFITAASWARVLFLIISTGWTTLTSNEDDVCNNVLVEPVRTALMVSFVEVFNSAVGFTRSPLAGALLFSCTRFGVETLVTPMIGCGSWQHLLTITMWSCDFVRFACFTVDTAVPGIRMVKSVRFTVGPLLFPVGAFAEMMMVWSAACDGKPKMYIAALLWPVFFYPMMKQLLKQRHKHFHPEEKKKQIKSV